MATVAPLSIGGRQRLRRLHLIAMSIAETAKIVKIAQIVVVVDPAKIVLVARVAGIA